MAGVDFIFVKAFTVSKLLTHIFSGLSAPVQKLSFLSLGPRKNFNDEGFLASGIQLCNFKKQEISRTDQRLYYF
jgi:hypothetical protein